VTTSTWYGAGTSEEQTRLAGAWPDAPTTDLESLRFMLETARDQVIEYAPTPAEGEDIQNTPKSRYVYAQLQQVQNLWNAGRVSSDGNLGDGGWTFTPRPLDKTIRDIIRPRSAKPDVL